MNIWFEEVIEAHVAIEQWLGAGKGELEALLACFTHDYSMVALSGARLDYPALCSFFRTSGGSREGLAIEVDSLQLLDEWPQGAAVLYRETQTLNGSSTVRWSTVIFRREGEKVLWRHLQETAQA
ncbi:DUF4440 domain-containing protein [Enterobacter sp. Ap-916]|uniref:DUF4440 domain-containing protein n=1 Tax=Enterobacteriaceae TaxID=543 RepID=UPI0002729B70|nr:MULTISPECIES: DUF4440 domain-containing protein [unclassified Enterobacter]EJF32280.1 hypothetical protein A936_04286 [Enterobacter sp. Ag1]NIF57314.1 DUF4440 domain-containing protein [Enterobacter sp. Ap-867]NIG28745.1 DUF4440 domain-containing protein [Enterobacter sp. Ap-916]